MGFVWWRSVFSVVAPFRRKEIDQLVKPKYQLSSKYFLELFQPWMKEISPRLKQLSRYVAPSTSNLPKELEGLGFKPCKGQEEIYKLTVSSQKTTLTSPLNKILETARTASLVPATCTSPLNKQKTLVRTTAPPKEKAKAKAKSGDKKSDLAYTSPQKQQKILVQTSAPLKEKAKAKTKAKSRDKESDPEYASTTEDPKTKEIDAMISKIIGMERLKLQLRKWIKGLILHERRKALNIKIAKRKVLHMAFLGNPGTGKTMVARMLGKILHKLGLINEERVVEVQRTDLVGPYIGQTGPKTKKKIKEARGGILFVDEAYRLMPSDFDSKDFGREALEEIMSVMNDGDIVVIFAGYTNQMQRVMSANPGFRRRVSKLFKFDDYSSTDIAMMMHLRMKNQGEDSSTYGFMLHSDCTVEAIAELISKNMKIEQLKMLNGGLVDLWLVNAMEILDVRLDVNCSDVELLQTIKMEDLEEGIKSLECLQRGD